MSQRHSHHTLRNKRQPTEDLSAPHLRALRKELLLVRADVERMELAQATVELRESITNFTWLRMVLPGFGGARVGRGLKAGFLNAGTIGALFKQYPVVSSLVSAILAKPLRATVAAGAKPALKWGGLAFAAWEAFRVWQQMKGQSSTADRSFGD